MGGKAAVYGCVWVRVRTGTELEITKSFGGVTDFEALHTA